MVLQLHHDRLLTYIMPPVKSGWPTVELHHEIFLSEKSSMTPRVIELGRLREITLRAHTPPQHLSLGNVPGYHQTSILL